MRQFPSSTLNCRIPLRKQLLAEAGPRLRGAILLVRCGREFRRGRHFCSCRSERLPAVAYRGPSKRLTASPLAAPSAAKQKPDAVRHGCCFGPRREPARGCRGQPSEWDDWACGIPIEVLLDPQRSLVRSGLRYVKSVEDEDATIVVLIPEILPNKRRHEILHNQRARLLAAVLKARINVVIATLPFHLHD
jgi:hypothetical protein